MKHPKFRFLCSLALVMALCAAFLAVPALAVSGDLEAQKPTKQEIQQKWSQVTQAESLFDVVPSAVAPYAAGRLSDSFLESGITYLNYIRFVAGLPQVQLNDTLNEDAQHGAVVLAAIDTLTHYPAQPADMDEAFFARGADATSSSNISARWGYAPVTCLQGAVSGCMEDNSSLSNLACLGHRRWLLNPRLLNVGFGYAEHPSSGWSYILTKVFDQSGAAIDYDYISWPASGNFPTNLFNTETPWSITLNPAKYKTPSADQVKITITRQSDGKTWRFDGTTGQPANVREAYMVVETSYYGVPNCIIFHPGSANVDAWEGVFSVDVSGIYTADGQAATLRYQVDFFDIDNCPEHRYTATVTAPTCTAEGYTTYTCGVCKDSYTGDPVAALGHSGTVVPGKAAGCLTEGLTDGSYCGRCKTVLTEQKAIAPLGHAYQTVVTAPRMPDGRLLHPHLQPLPPQLHRCPHRPSGPQLGQRRHHPPT